MTTLPLPLKNLHIFEVFYKLTSLWQKGARDMSVNSMLIRDVLQLKPHS